MAAATDGANAPVQTGCLFSSLTSVWWKIQIAAIGESHSGSLMQTFQPPFSTEQFYF